MLPSSSGSCAVDECWWNESPSICCGLFRDCDWLPLTHHFRWTLPTEGSRNPDSRPKGVGKPGYVVYNPLGLSQKATASETRLPAFSLEGVWYRCQDCADTPKQAKETGKDCAGRLPDQQPLLQKFTVRSGNRNYFGKVLSNRCVGVWSSRCPSSGGRLHFLRIGKCKRQKGDLSSSASFQLNRELKSCFFLIFERNVDLFYFEFFVIWIFSLLFNNVSSVQSENPHLDGEQKLSTNTIILVPRSYFRSKIRKSI